jgi:60 kDa SS-A/Ro ribonucleoprotein
MKTNVKKKTSQPYTHNGAKASRCSNMEKLRRTVMACLLWEKTFYEDGKSVVERIKELVPLCDPKQVSDLAIECRQSFKLRHAPLMLVLAMLESRKAGVHAYAKESSAGLIQDTLETIIERADEMGEFLSLYWGGTDRKAGKPVPNLVKRALAKAFVKFDEYQLSKYQSRGGITLRDVMFVCHPKPESKKQAAVWKKLANKKLASADTWEVELSASTDKLESWTRLIKENKLGGLAYLRNLRNMTEVGVKDSLIRDGFSSANFSKVLPFRFVAAAKIVPQYEDILEEYMLKALEKEEKIPGTTILLVDVSGSMDDKISEKSDLTRLNAACSLAILMREVCERVTVCTFSRGVVTVPPRRGFALAEAIDKSQAHGGTYMGLAVDLVQKQDHDRLVVFTDEQSSDVVKYLGPKAYIINVASYQNGVMYGQKTTHVSGFSESVVRYIQECERLSADED